MTVAFAESYVFIAYVGARPAYVRTPADANSVCRFFMEVYMIADNLSVNSQGHLCFAGQDTVLLAKEYGTPLYVMDEARIRHNIRLYTKTFSEVMPAGSKVLYASKANAFKQMYRLLGEEGAGADIVSCGEMVTARAAGFDLKNAYFHSNNKTDADIAMAVAAGVGCFVSDGREELIALDAVCARSQTKQRVMLRITPGIDPHTYAAVNTGMVDSKFGAAIETGQAMELTKLALGLKNIELVGFHCHVGSEVFFEDVFERAARVMLAFVAETKEKLGFICKELNLGGGYGVRYVETDPFVDIPAKIKSVAAVLYAECERLGLAVPAVLMEPGRSIVADAGLTLYTCGTVKRIPGYKNYVSVDGGMSDDPRFALYGARYTCVPASKMEEERPFIASLVGRCCESDDVIQNNVPFPASVQRGDIIAVLTTGAYNYSMASNYNRLPRPAVVMLKDGASYVAVKRETFEDLIRLDV